MHQRQTLLPADSRHSRQDTVWIAMMDTYITIAITLF